MARRKGRETFRKVITSPELIAQINPKNQQLADRFLKNFATKRSPNSVISYRSNLNIFMCWNILWNENKFFVDIKKYELMDFFDFCVTELKWGSNRYAQMHSVYQALVHGLKIFMMKNIQHLGIYFLRLKNCQKKQLERNLYLKKKNWTS